MDVFDIPQKYVCDVKIYKNNSTAAGVGLQVWDKPRGASMVYMFLLGGGGGGGGGEYDTVGSGGVTGGGGSSAQTRVLLPASVLPDRLYISVGIGGAGGTAPASTTAGTAGGTGGTGTNSYVFLQPVLISTPSNPTVNNIVAYATGGIGAPAGGNGNGAQAGGAAGLVSTIGGMPLAGLGVYQFLAGQAGATPNLSSTQTTLALPVTGLLVTAGGGGGSATGTVGGNGGRILTAGSNVPEIQGGIANTSSLDSARGSAGISIFGDQGVVWSTGGGGGAGSGATANVGGSGGAGGIGSGGGTGGNMITASPLSGAGGRGGDGIVIIISW